MSWPLYLVTACAAPLYLQIFGSGYRADGVSVVVVMAIAMMLAMAAGPLDTLLLMAGGSTASLANTIVALVIDIGLCFILIPRWGILGAAVAWAASVVVRNALTFVQVYRLNRVTPFSRGCDRGRVGQHRLLRPSVAGCRGAGGADGLVVSRGGGARRGGLLRDPVGRAGPSLCRRFVPSSVRSEQKGCRSPMKAVTA